VGRKDVIRSVFQINDSVGCLWFIPSLLSRESKRFSSEVPSRPWLMSQISMVTFDQRSANSLISRLIINRVKHIGSLLILAGGNADSGERKKAKEKGRARSLEGGWGLEWQLCPYLLPPSLK
jgi:hypothetical protein